MDNKLSKNIQLVNQITILVLKFWWSRRQRFKVLSNVKITPYESIKVPGRILSPIVKQES